MAHNICPYCGEEIDAIYYTEEGMMEWDKVKQRWYNSDRGDVYYKCPNCDTEFTLEDLEVMEVFS